MNENKPWKLTIITRDFDKEFIGVKAKRGRDELFAKSFSELEEKIKEWMESK